MEGQRHTPETKQKISASKTGVPRTPEAKIAISQGVTEVWRDPLYRERISAVMKSVKGSPEAREAARAKRMEVLERERVRRDFLVEEVGEIETSLWEAAVGENLIEPILGRNLMTKSEMEKVRRAFENGRNPSRKLLEKFSIAVARVA